MEVCFMVNIWVHAKNGMLCITVFSLMDGCERQKRGEFLLVSRALEWTPRHLLCVEREKADRNTYGLRNSDKWVVYLVRSSERERLRSSPSVEAGLGGPVGMGTKCKDLCLTCQHPPEDMHYKRQYTNKW